MALASLNAYPKCRLAANLNFHNVRTYYNRLKIGTRDWVGHGMNGSANYRDDALQPFPPIRFRDYDKDLCALRERERGDWRLLTCEEKKGLYRASFCSTFAEFQHPTGEWKFTLGCGLICCSVAFWMAIFYYYFVHGPRPHTFAEECRKAQLRRMLDLRVDPLWGLCSKWDYDNDRWK